MPATERAQKRKSAEASQAKPVIAPKRARVDEVSKWKSVQGAASKSQSKPAPKPQVLPTETPSNDFDGFGSGSELDDDQTAALLAGFESSDDSDAGVAIPEDDAKDAKPLPSFPESEDLEARLEAADKKKAEGGAAGTIYVGRLPHGFYEHQMKAYFSQFGDISRLRMAHNRRTGASKHYAFIEFTVDEVAKIVADTMDNYLMYGHILKVKYVPTERVHPKLWEGANRRFRKIPWNRIERSKLEKSDREGWKKRTAKEEKRRAAKLSKLKSIGYDFEAPKLKDVDTLPVQKIADEVDSREKAAKDDDGPKQIEAAPPIIEGTVEAIINGAAPSKQKTSKTKVKATAGAKRRKA